MNFKQISEQLGKSEVISYEAEKSFSKISSEIHELIEKNGLEIFKDFTKLSEEIAALELSVVEKNQLTLLFSSSHLPEFLTNSQENLSLVDVDAALHDVLGSTGLSYFISVRLISDILYGAGLSVPVEYGPRLSDDKIEYQLQALVPTDMVQSEVAKATQLLDELKKTDEDQKEKNGDKVKEAVALITRLCEAGIPEGFYLLGRCYMYGEAGTDIDMAHALELLKVAAERGVPEAAGIVGDIYYQSENSQVRDYTLAHHYYTRPGTQALDENKQAAIKDIYQQRVENKMTFVFSAVMLLAMIAFLVFFHTGLFSDSSRLVWGIVCILISAGAYAVSIIAFRMRQYDSIRRTVALQYFVWVLYAFIFILA